MKASEHLVRLIHSRIQLDQEHSNSNCSGIRYVKKRPSHNHSFGMGGTKNGHFSYNHHPMLHLIHWSPLPVLILGCTLWTLNLIFAIGIRTCVFKAAKQLYSDLFPGRGGWVWENGSGRGLYVEGVVSFLDVEDVLSFLDVEGVLLFLHRTHSYLNYALADLKALRLCVCTV